MWITCDMCEPGEFIKYCQSKFGLFDFVLLVVIILLLAGALYWEYTDQSNLDEIPFAPEDSDCNCEIYGCYAANRVGWRILYISSLIAAILISYVLWMLKYPLNFFIFFIILFINFLLVYAGDGYFRYHTYQTICDRSRGEE